MKEEAKEDRGRADGEKPEECIVHARNGKVDMIKLAAGGDPMSAFEWYEPGEEKPALRVNADFEPRAECPRFKAYLEEVFPLQVKKAELLMKFAGYTLLPHNQYNRACILLGSGANGKSSFISTLAHILGRSTVLEYCIIDDLGSEFNLAQLINKRLVCCNELKLTAKKQKAASVLKSIIAGNEISARYKYAKEIVAFRPTCKFIFHFNAESDDFVVEQDHGLMDRMLRIEFNHTFTPNCRDRDLPSKLKSEASGIFMLMLEGAVQLMRSGGFE